MTRARDLSSLGDNTSKLEQQGMVQVIASSVTKGASGSASVDSKGNVTFSGTESISLNGVFSSTYENYRVLFKGSLATGSGDLKLRLRADGSNNTTSNYFYYGVAGGGITVTSFGSSFQSEILLGSTSTVDPDFFVLDFMNPQLSSNATVLVGNYVYSGNGTIRNLYAAQSQFISFDGFSIYPASSTISGKITVYGYNK